MKKPYKYNNSFKAMEANISDLSYGGCPAPMKAQQALYILSDYLLGDDWYFASSCNVEQGNAMVVELILDKYSKKWRKDWAQHEKELYK